MQVFIYCKITLYLPKRKETTIKTRRKFKIKQSLHVSGVHRAHHQDNTKLKLQPLVQVIVSEQQPSSDMA